MLFILLAFCSDTVNRVIQKRTYREGFFQVLCISVSQLVGIHSVETDCCPELAIATELFSIIFITHYYLFIPLLFLFSNCAMSGAIISMHA